MKTMKRAVIVFLVISLTTFVGCGSDDTDNQSDPGGVGGPGGGLGGGGLGGGGLGGGGTGGTGGGGTGGGGGGAGGGGGGAGGGGGEETTMQYQNVRLNDLTDQQSVTVCREAFSEYAEQFDPTKPIGKGACLWHSVNYAIENFDEGDSSSLLSICKSVYNDCTSQTFASYDLDFDDCLPKNTRSQCSATVETFSACVSSRQFMKNMNFRSTATETCDSVFADLEFFEDYYDKMSNEYGTLCVLLSDQCPVFFESDEGEEEDW